MFWSRGIGFDYIFVYWNLIVEIELVCLLKVVTVKTRIKTTADHSPLDGRMRLPVEVWLLLFFYFFFKQNYCFSHDLKFFLSRMSFVTFPVLNVQRLFVCLIYLVGFCLFFYSIFKLFTCIDCEKQFCFTLLGIYFSF